MNEKNVKQIALWMSQGLRGLALARTFSHYMDRLLCGIFNSVHKNARLVLLATGGYGREELAPFSDIDIMFFAKNREHADTAERILYALWDSGLEISHSFRTAEECIEEAFKDIRTRTSLIEARYIAGDRKLYQVFRNDVYPVIAYQKKRSFIREKLKEMEKRHLESGDSVFLLEPHIKEGEGSLRDVHTVYWLSKVAFKLENFSDLPTVTDAHDYRRLLKAYDFMLQLRYCLHLESRRRNDIFSFEYQKNVAACLGFKDSKKFSGPERMMRYYYLKSKAIKDVTKQIAALCGRQYMPVFKNLSIKRITEEFSISAGKLIATKQNLLGTNTDKIMESFYLYARTGKMFSDKLKENIRDHLLKINNKTRGSSVSIYYFLEIFKCDQVYDTLREMHESGVLGRFVPEFGALRWLVVHEPYHMYTVDEHTLLAVRSLERLKTTKYRQLEEMRNIINNLENLDLLFISILFHDIGKAAGRHHEEEGYKRLKHILERFNLESSKKARIEFLVKNHILMARLAMRSEASDMDVISRFSGVVGDLENLNALYLMTYADMSAVNPRFWTSWKSYLLHDLYLSTREYLLGIKQGRAEYIRNLLRDYPEIEAEELIRFIDEMPERYFLSTSKPKVIADYHLKKRAMWEFFSMRADNRSDGVTEIVICTKDSPGLFSKIVGFLSSKRLNIFSGSIFTGKSGVVIDRISISNWKDIWWEGLERDLEVGLRGILIDDKPVQLVRRKVETNSLFDLFIELDNESSPVFSIIEIFTQDRLGLLYDISTVMHEKGINIVSARINTESGLAQDVFYVQADDNKITGKLIQELLSALWTLLRK
jgi:[protein-PII] uridylyltransferase